MTQQKTRKTAQMLQVERDARKQALGVLHRVYKQYVRIADPFDEKLANEAYSAFRELGLLIHGKPTGMQRSSLCDFCHEAYFEHWVEIREEGAHSISSFQYCCPLCKDRLLEEGKALSVNGKSVASQEQEVQA